MKSLCARIQTWGMEEATGHLSRLRKCAEHSALQHRMFSMYWDFDGLSARVLPVPQGYVFYIREMKSLCARIQICGMEEATGRAAIRE